MIRKLPFLLLLATLVALLQACAGGDGGKPAVAADVIERSKAFAFNGAVVALEVLDAREAAYLRGLKEPTAKQLEDATVRVERLERARDALELVRQWLDGKRPDGRTELADAVRALGIVAAELKSQGVDVPPRVADGLQLAAAFLEASK